MFLNIEDFRVVIGDASLRALSQCSPRLLDLAEAEAVREVSSYLRPAYDCNAIFTTGGDDRDPLIVMYTADIALYHLAASLPQKMGAEIRKERYERAIRWLEGVQAGKIVPDLPKPAENDRPASLATVFHSEPRLRHNW